MSPAPPPTPPPDAPPDAAAEHLAEDVLDRVRPARCRARRRSRCPAPGPGPLLGARATREERAAVGRARAGAVPVVPAAVARGAAEHAAQAALTHPVGEPGHDDRGEDRQQLLHEAPATPPPEAAELAHDLVGVAAEDVADDGF